MLDRPAITNHSNHQVITSGAPRTPAHPRHEDTEPPMPWGLCVESPQGTAIEHLQPEKLHSASLERWFALQQARRTQSYSNLYSPPPGAITANIYNISRREQPIDTHHVTDEIHCMCAFSPKGHCGVNHHCQEPSLRLPNLYYYNDRDHETERRYTTKSKIQDCPMNWPRVHPSPHQGSNRLDQLHMARLLRQCEKLPDAHKHLACLT